MTSSEISTGPCRLSGIVVHWNNEELLDRLVEAWPEDPRFELIVVDNSASAEVSEQRVRLLRPAENLGFGGGANLGVREARAPVVLILNPDAVPEPGALEALLDGFRRHPEAMGLAPRLSGSDGEPQFRWQLRPLPTLLTLLAQALLIPAGAGSPREPAEGSLVEQPAAAALALRRRAFVDLGGFDERFYPAWFEDVDLARRFQNQNLPLLYWPASRFRHGLGGSVPHLGYGPFLWIYYRNLMLYLAKHHGPLGVGLARLLLAVGMVLRGCLLPLRKPKRATSRGQAAAGLWAVIAGAASNWQRPRRLRQRFSRSEPPE
ncbi:MAG: glycosyltransferase family 2 protein [Deltaproteobacteria bacterium]|nr:glycosyltransferase family 2 protein [Deltaproteobacteria bacterium]